MGRAAKDGAIILPLIGLVLFTPPFIQAFDIPEKVFGIPVFLFSLTLTWIAGIALTAYVANCLMALPSHSDPEATAKIDPNTGDSLGSPKD